MPTLIDKPSRLHRVIGLHVFMAMTLHCAPVCLINQALLGSIPAASLHVSVDITNVIMPLLCAVPVLAHALFLVFVLDGKLFLGVRIGCRRLN